MSKDLPDDVVIDILLRLPVKTLIRFRCVSKSWCTTISSHNFISMHRRNRARSHNADSIQYFSDGRPNERKLRCFLYGEKSENPVELEIPFNCLSKCFMVGPYNTYNGLVCLSEFGNSHGKIYLWNPSIRKFKTLPSSSITGSFYDFLGFGFHHQTNDYKVVRLMYLRNVNWKYIVEVYTLSMDSWRKIEADAPCFIKPGVLSAFVNGCVHWLASSLESNVQGLRDRIMAFDIGDEVFREMKLPDYSIGKVNPCSMSIAVSQKSLCLCTSFSHERRINFWYGCTYIWVMTDYGIVESWTKRYKIAIPGIRVQRLLGFTKNNELLLETTKRRLISYDHNIPENQEFKFHGVSESNGPTNAVTFMETLVLLEGGNDDQEGLKEENTKISTSRVVAGTMEEH